MSYTFAEYQMDCFEVEFGIDGEATITDRLSGRFGMFDVVTGERYFGSLSFNTAKYVRDLLAHHWQVA